MCKATEFVLLLWTQEKTERYFGVYLCRHFAMLCSLCSKRKQWCSSCYSSCAMEDVREGIPMLSFQTNRELLITVKARTSANITDRTPLRGFSENKQRREVEDTSGRPWTSHKSCFISHGLLLLHLIYLYFIIYFKKETIKK